MKKILFNDKYGLTEAVLEGRKTMTRRVIPELLGMDDVDLSEFGIDDRGKAYITEYKSNIDIYPRFQPEERVAVAQRYSELSWDKKFYEKLKGMCTGLPQKRLAGWDNKMFVRADLMPHQIRITNVRIERLHSITVADCFKEGINTIVEGKSEIGNPWGWDTKVDYFKRDNYLTPLQAFANLIDKVSGKGTWLSNPYVFVYEFELVK